MSLQAWAADILVTLFWPWAGSRILLWLLRDRVEGFRRFVFAHLGSWILQAIILGGFGWTDHPSMGTVIPLTIGQIGWFLWDLYRWRRESSTALKS